MKHDFVFSDNNVLLFFQFHVPIFEYFLLEYLMLKGGDVARLSISSLFILIVLGTMFQNSRELDVIE